MEDQFTGWIRVLFVSVKLLRTRERASYLLPLISRLANRNKAARRSRYNSCPPIFCDWFRACALFPARCSHSLGSGSRRAAACGLASIHHERDQRSRSADYERECSCVELLSANVCAIIILLIKQITRLVHLQYIYAIIARKLTDWEEHATQTAYGRCSPGFALFRVSPIQYVAIPHSAAQRILSLSS
jgi:hypothetical protein